MAERTEAPAGARAHVPSAAVAGSRESALDAFVKRLALAAAAGAALLAAAAGAWRDLSAPSLLLRAAVVMGVVFAFVRLGGGLVGRALLHGLAEHQLRSEEASAEGTESAPRNAPEERASRAEKGSAAERKAA